MLKIVGPLCCALLLPGCITSAFVAATTTASTQDRGTQVQQSQVDQFQKGVATEADVESKLGKPQSTGQAANGDKTLTYVYAKGSATATSDVPVVRWMAKGTQWHSTRVDFEFDKTGHLVNTASSQSDTDCTLAGNCSAG
jgi:outer membrane protein assembly factor BamE (lipoprotein component of BamABCDE complex)